MRKKKKPRKGSNSKYQQYSKKTIEDAYNAVVVHKMTVYQAAKEFNIPYMTLSDKIHGKRPLYTKLGRKSLLPEDNENAFAAHVKYLFSIGYGFAKADFLQMATDYALHLGKRNLKGHDKIGKIWYYNFLKKHPDVISVRPFSKPLCVTRESIVKYYTDFEALLEEHKLQSKPETIYILDKVDFEYNTSTNSTHDSVDHTTGIKTATMMFIGAGNSIGKQIPGYLVFSDDTMDAESAVTPNCAVTERSWLDGDVLKQYFLETFLPCAAARGKAGRSAKHPLVVLYDAHKFITYPGIVKWLLDKNVILFPLPPHASLYQQAKTISLLTGFEDLYNKHVIEMDVSSTYLPRIISEVALKVYNIVTDKTSLSLVFSKLGIVPYNAFALNRPVVNAKVKQAKWTDSQRAKKKDKCSPMDDSESDNDDSDSDSCAKNERQKHLKRKPGRDVVKLQVGKIKLFELRKSKRKCKKRKFSSSEEDDDYNSNLQSDDNSDIDEYNADANQFSIVTDDNNSGVELTTNIEVNENVDLEIENIEANAWIENEQKCCACEKVETPGGDLAMVDWVHCECCSHWMHLIACANSGQLKDGKFYCTHCVPYDTGDEKNPLFVQNVFHSL